MRLKQMTGYMLKNSLKFTGLFYGILLLFILTLFVFSLVVQAQNVPMGTGNSSMFFLFLLGIVTYYSYLKAGFTFGISRRTVFFSFVLSALIIAAIVGFLDMALSWLIPTLLYGLINVTSPSGGFWAGSFLASFAVMFSYYFAVALTALTLGHFIGSLYYRMSNALKIVVSVGVPAVVFVGLPILFGNLLPDAVNVAVWNAIFALQHFLAESPLHMTLLYALGAVFCIVLLRALLHKTPVKAK